MLETQFLGLTVRKLGKFQAPGIAEGSVAILRAKDQHVPVSGTVFGNSLMLLTARPWGVAAVKVD